MNNKGEQGKNHFATNDIVELLLNFVDGLEAACVDLKFRVRQAVDAENGEASSATRYPKAEDNEQIFSGLNWEEGVGPRLGKYERASKGNNQPAPYDKALNFLRDGKHLIGTPLRAGNYLYWHYIRDDRPTIYRKKSK